MTEKEFEDLSNEEMVKQTTKIYKEFNLSEKMLRGNHGFECSKFMATDVKEFIRREDILLVRLRNGDITWGEFWTLKDKLAGEELTNTGK